MVRMKLGLGLVASVLLCGVAGAQYPQYHESTYQLRGRGGAVTGPEEITYGWFLPDGKLVTVGYHEPPQVSQSFDLQERKVHDTYLISLWDPQTGARLGVDENQRELEAADVSPDGRYLAAWDGDRVDDYNDGSVRLFDIGSRDHNFGDQLAVLGGLTRHISDVEFSPDGKLVAVHYYGHSRNDNKDDRQLCVRVFKCDSATEYCSFLLAGDYPVLKLRFSPNGRYLAGFGNDQTVLWDVKSRKQVCTLAETEDGYEGSFTSASDAIVHIWPKEGFLAKAYRIRADNIDSKTSKDFESTKALRLLHPSGMSGQTVMREIMDDEVEVRDVMTGKPAVRFVRAPKPPLPQGVPPTLEISYEWNGVHDISDDGRFALVDSQVVDLKSGSVRMLDLLPEKGYRPWGIVGVE